MKKMPWGIAAGLCSIAVFYLTAGVIVAVVILGAIAGQTNTAATIFDNWWQVLLFVLDIVFALALCVSAAMYALGKIRGKREDVKGGAE